MKITKHQLKQIIKEEILKIFEGYYSRDYLEDPSGTGHEGAYGDPSHEPLMGWEERRNAGWRDGIKGKKPNPELIDNNTYMDSYNLGKEEFLKNV
jgi:hypothetical protein